MTDAVTHLSDKQLAALDRLLLGESIASIAREIGAARETIYRWQMIPAFRNELAARRATLHDQAIDRLRDLVPKAVLLMERAIEAEMAKDRPDWRVAAKILDIIGKCRAPMPTIDVAFAVGTDAVDPDAPPTTKLRTMEELRQRNRQMWEDAGLRVQLPRQVASSVVVVGAPGDDGVAGEGD